MSVNKVVYGGLMRTQFLDTLTSCLRGNVSENEIRETLKYYNDYIDSQINLGFSEETVLKNLGDARLIAKTIIQTKSGNKGSAGSNPDRAAYQEGPRYQNFKGASRDYKEKDFGSGSFNSSWFNQNPFNDTSTEVQPISKIITMFLNLPKWIKIAASVAILILAIIIVFSIVSFLFPIAITVAIVIFAIKLFRDWL